MGRAQRRKQERVPTPRAPVQSAPARPRGAAPADLRVERALLAPLLIATVVAVLYANSFKIPFTFDDYFEIASNPTVKAIEPLGNYLSRSRGIPALTFALNYRWGGLDVWSFHLVNVLVHVANGLLVYALVLRTLRLPALRPRYRESAGVLAGLVALVFVAHPLQTMAASYIVQRSESLAAFFYLLTLLVFSFASTTAARRLRYALYAVAGGTALLGAVSKEIVATVPVAALAYRLCFLPSGERQERGVRLALAAALLLPLAYGLLLAKPYLFPAAETVASDEPRAWLYIPTAGFRVEGIGSWRYLLTQFGVIWWYLRLFILPTRQCFDYGWPFADSFWQGDVLIPLAALFVLVAVAVVSYRRYPLATFCIAWLFITLAPTSSIIPLRDAAFEQRMYLPIVGLSWLVVVGGYDLLGWAAPRLGARAASLRRGGAAAAAAWIALLGVATVARNTVMQDPIALAADSIEKAPDNWRAHSTYGEALIDAGRTDEAMKALEEAVRLNPRSGSARVQLGQLYIRAGRTDEAETVLTPVTSMLEESVVAAAAVQLASIREMRGDLDGAAAQLQHALTLKPDWALSHAQLGSLYARLGFWYGASNEYRKAIQLKPHLAEQVGAQTARVSYFAALGMQEAGKPRGAVSLLRTAVTYRPEWTAAHHSLAYAYAALGEWEHAQQELEKLSASDDPLIQENLRRARDRQPLLPPPTEGPPRPAVAAAG